MAKLLITDWVPRYEDGGYDELIKSIAAQGLDIKEALALINDAGSQPEMTESMLLKYIIDRKAAGALETIEVRGAAYPDHTERPAAPTGLGGDIDNIWFSTPTENLGEDSTLIYWYINGELAASEHQDVTSNRSAPAAVTDVLESGDVVQVAVVGDAIGWWARIEI